MIGKTLSIGLLMVSGTAAESANGDWHDLRERCEASVLTGEKLNLAGLEDRLPDVFFDVVDDTDLLGPRVELGFSGPRTRTVPTGVWGARGGAFELWLTEYPTRAGFRAICEVREARGYRVSQEETAALRDAFEAEQQGAESIAVSNENLTAFRLNEGNPRGCPVVTSFSSETLRATVSEAAGHPNCGGPSLASGVITPHGILPPKAGG